MKRIVLLLAMFAIVAMPVEAKPKKKGKRGVEYLAPWTEGDLYIHHISTGRGSAIFFMLPDGTRMLADAGDLGDPARWTHKEIMPAVPNATKRPAEWIARYIEHFSAPLNKPLYLDYAMITHFDCDHYGFLDHLAITAEGKPYKYTGMTHLANLVNVNKLIDRGYPNYDYPSAEAFRKRNGKLFENYSLFVKEREEMGLAMEQFCVGSDKQFVLTNKAEKYPTFRIRNVAGNGDIWSGRGNEVNSMISSDAPANAFLNENSSSCVFRLEYGNFAYYLGGDIGGTYSKKKNNYWIDAQTPVSKVIGTVDVAVADHHGYRDSMNDNLLKALQANAIILPVWDLYHPHPNAMNRIIKNGVTEVFPAGMTAENLKVLTEKNLAENIRPAGHIVVRVTEGGAKYQIFVLDDRSLDYKVIYKSKVFTSKSNIK